MTITCHILRQNYFLAIEKKAMIGSCIGFHCKVPISLFCLVSKLKALKCQQDEVLYKAIWGAVKRDTSPR